MKHRIVVLGAGYAGAHAAGRLARRLHPNDTEITVVNTDPDFVERVRMHQLAAGQNLRRRTLSDVYAGTGVTVRPARVTTVDVSHKTVELVDQHGADEMAYDALVYALGSTAADHGVPGVAAHDHHVAGKQAALRLRERLRNLAAGATVLVVGGGLTGVEAATEIAETRPDLDVAIAVPRGAGDWLSDKGWRHLRSALDRLGITVHEQTEVARVDKTGADVARCISLGRHDGIIQFVNPDDQVKAFVVKGSLAARIKEFVCAGAAWSIAHPTVMLPTRRRNITAAVGADTCSATLRRWASMLTAGCTRAGLFGSLSSRTSGSGRFEVRGIGSLSPPVDRDHRAGASGGAVAQAQRGVRAVGEQSPPGAQDHRGDHQQVRIDEISSHERPDQDTAAHDHEIDVGVPLQVGDGGRNVAV